MIIRDVLTKETILTEPLSILDMLQYNTSVFISNGNEQDIDEAYNHIFVKLVEDSVYPTKFCELLAVYIQSVRETVTLSINGKVANINLMDIINRVRKFKPLSEEITIDIDGEASKLKLETSHSLFCRDITDIYKGMIQGQDNKLSWAIDQDEIMKKIPASYISIFSDLIEKEFKQNKNLYIIEPNDMIMPEGLKFNASNAFEFVKKVWAFEQSPDALYSVITQLSQLGFGNSIDSLTYRDYENIIREYQREQNNNQKS